MTDASSNLWLAIFAATVVTLIPRLLGGLLAGRIGADSGWFRWFSCVAYALLAALISRMVLMPVGPVATTDLSNRLAAVGLALAVFFLGRRNVLLGAGAGAVALVCLTVGNVHFLG